MRGLYSRGRVDCSSSFDRAAINHGNPGALDPAILTSNQISNQHASGRQKVGNPRSVGGAGCSPHRPKKYTVNVHDIEAGEDWCAALAGRGLIRPAEEALLEAAKAAGNLPWALRQAAENSERRLSYRFQVWVSVFLPLCLLLIGALVFLFAFAYFAPLIVVIENLTGSL